MFSEAEEYFLRAVRRLTLRNANPRGGEPFYNLGLAAMYSGKCDEAYEAFHKSVWNYTWQSAGYYALAGISTQRGKLSLALEQIEQSLMANGRNLKARALKAALLRKTGRSVEAQSLIAQSLANDGLDFRTMIERFFLGRTAQDLHAFLNALQPDIQTLLDVTYDLAWSGLRDDAIFLLDSCAEIVWCDVPMFWYTFSWFAAALGRDLQAQSNVEKAESISPRYCFPARLEEMIVLEDCIKRNPSGARAYYYLGNLYYDKRRYQDAIRCWRSSVERDDTFSIPWRNLGIAEFNVLHDSQAADRMYARAFAASPGDARVFYEWDQLKKRARLASPQERLHTLNQHLPLVESRDDLSVEYVTLLNQADQWQQALDRLSARRFSPWKGGEGLVAAQYVYAQRALGREALVAGDARAALDHFEAARVYPHNLGEGKHFLVLERDLDYFSGLAAVKLGDAELAARYWQAAAAPLPALGIHSYFQALALRALGNADAARTVLSDLAEFAAAQMKKEPKIDYFATSLPNLLLFDDDIARQNRVESLLLSALAHLGLGQTEDGGRELQHALAEDPNHLLAIETLRWFQVERANAVKTREAQASL